MKFKFVPFIFILSLVFLFSTCKTGKPKVEKVASVSEAVPLSDTSGDEPEILKDILFLFPSPGEIIEGFFHSELKYKPGLLYPVEYRDKSHDQRSQALSLGIYLTDLAYSAKYGITGESQEYLEVIHYLSDQVGVSTVVFESLIDRASANLTNPDSIVSIAEEAFCQLFTFLETSKKESTFAIISTGAYIECLYILLETKDEFNEDDPVFAQVSELKYPFNKLLLIASNIEADKDVTSLFTYLNSINQAFDQLAVDENMKEGELIISDGARFTLSAENFTKIKSAIQSIRAEITSI